MFIIYFVVQVYGYRPLCALHILLCEIRIKPSILINGKSDLSVSHVSCMQIALNLQCVLVRLWRRMTNSSNFAYKNCIFRLKIQNSFCRVRGSVPGLGGLKETKMFLPHPRVKVSIVGSLRDREVACSASDRQGSNFESCVWRTVSSQSSHHPQEVLLAQFSLYVHKGGLKPESFHFLHMEIVLLVRQNIVKIYPNLEIHTEVYILIDLCSVEARVIISTRSTKFYPVAIFYLHISKKAAIR